MTTAPPDSLDRAARVFSEREFAFTREDFHKISELLHADAGIVLGDTKAPLVYARLVRRLRLLGIGSFARYCALIESQQGGAERLQMIGALTTNVTRFFREPHHFEHFKATLADLAPQVREGLRLRVWSAGCASGEEAYSIALSILQVMPDAPGLDVRVLATDINPAVLAVGEAGEYDDHALESVTQASRAEWFQTVRGVDGRKRSRAGEPLRDLVAFRRLNLLDPWPMTAVYQAIFCRNVLIYFDESRQTEIHRRMKAMLAPEGRLYLGAAERVRDVEGLRPDGITAYRRTDSAQAIPCQEVF